MPWNWQGRGDNSTEIGGSRGSYEEASVAHAWPKYEGEYLAKRLKEGKGKYAGPKGKGAPDEIKEFIYFDKISEDYKQEADECLKQEFSQWLLGQHQDNENREIYKNGEGKPVRKAVFRYDNEIPGSKLKADWKPTWWGQKQLTHLPGVREYLTNMKVHSAANDFKMNLLAEFGPQDLEQAWVYFKHWVKGRPVAPEVTMSMPLQHPGIFGDGQMLPPGMKSWRETAGDDKMKQTPSQQAEMKNRAAENSASSDAKDVGKNIDESVLKEIQSRFNEQQSTIESLYIALQTTQAEIARLNASTGISNEEKEQLSSTVADLQRQIELEREQNKASSNFSLEIAQKESQLFRTQAEELNAELEASVRSQGALAASLQSQEVQSQSILELAAQRERYLLAQQQSLRQGNAVLQDSLDQQVQHANLLMQQQQQLTSERDSLQNQQLLERMRATELYQQQERSLNAMQQITEEQRMALAAALNRNAEQQMYEYELDSKVKKESEQEQVARIAARVNEDQAQLLEMVDLVLPSPVKDDAVKDDPVEVDEDLNRVQDAVVSQLVKVIKMERDASHAVADAIEQGTPLQGEEALLPEMLAQVRENGLLKAHQKIVIAKQSTDINVKKEALKEVANIGNGISQEWPRISNAVALQITQKATLRKGRNIKGKAKKQAFATTSNQALGDRAFDDSDDEVQETGFLDAERRERLAYAAGNYHDLTNA